MATAESIYADPSALLKLYRHERESATMNAWRAKTKGALPLTHHGRLEITNGICLAAHRGEITQDAFADALASFEEDFALGLYRQADLLWRATLNRAAELSRSYSAKIGTRSLDVLHVASALELELRYFVTFDSRQQELVRAVGLKVVTLVV
ncbi:MAG: type II toxin-antitoxin system VapC family toxin [Opitutaceae bacterium]|nr:type II toxin-antitoxin system VapC family toxin [Opitutaceae bacterium]